MTDHSPQPDDLDAHLNALHAACDVADATSTRIAIMRRIDRTSTHPRRQWGSLVAAALLLGAVGLLSRHFAVGSGGAPEMNGQMLVVQVQRVNAGWMREFDAAWEDAWDEMGDDHE